MWWFKKQKKNQIEDQRPDTQTSQTVEHDNPIPKEKFILDDSPVNNTYELPIYTIYARFQEDWEAKGYRDSTSFPDTSYRENQKRVIIDQLRLAIKEALLHYADKLVDIDIQISQAQKNGLMETFDKYVQEKKKLVAHNDELSALDKDAEEIGEKTRPIITSYEMGFTRGLVSLSNEKVSEIMSK